ncbi:hypothetical protein BKH41_08875 [Helicobacter sp. 12S02232-10]|uniref:hypothetical protein n=1 Tax=Helicobacter sp. 12S02232-10 TaxID=1476197 RepID=UPI000BA690FB|nr:hypothetical protein [Helicobacter sp. 12S02232-10]PAF46608.1 hypothetical protein BKH41_08875 [Helicobacter sp. 12S02232-10]
MKKTLIAVLLSSVLLNASTDTPILLQQVSLAFEEIKQFNEDVKVAMENLDQIKTLNKTLDSIDIKFI